MQTGGFAQSFLFIAEQIERKCKLYVYKLFKPLGWKSFYFLSDLQSSARKAEQKFHIVVSQINGFSFASVSGMIKQPSLCMRSESELHLMCLAKKVTKFK